MEELRIIIFELVGYKFYFEKEFNISQQDS